MPETDQLETCPAFKHAGEKPGLEIWRIEKLEPVKQLETTFGKFYIGDAYIVLNTKQKLGGNKFEYDLHFWLGDLCSQDEQGSAAIRAVELDELGLGGVAVQYRETQGHESKLFLSYFKSGIRYLEGGVEGALKKVDPDKFEKRMFQVKGKKNIRIAQVECSFGSLNQGDTFVLDCGRNIYVWVGPTTEKKEKLGGTELAKRIRDEERGGKAHIHIIEDDWDTNEEFFKALGKREKMIRAANDQDDDDIIRKIDQDIMLYEIMDSGEDRDPDKINPVAHKPLEQKHLNSKNCYVLDVGCAGIYVWLGKFCRTEFKTKVWSSVNKFLEKRNYPRWVAVTKVVDGGETSAFKQYFKGWAVSAPAPSAPQNNHVATQDYSGADSVDAGALHKKAGKTEQWLLDDGTGKVEVWRIEKNELVVVPQRAHGVFFGGDCYVILYTYGVPGKEQYIIYFWQGRDSTTDDKTASAGHAVALDNKLGGRAVQIRVVEFKEPLHFMKIFHGKLIVFSSGHVTGYQNAHCHAQYDPNAVYMFQVCGDSEETTRAIQVKARCSSLNSNDLFVISKGKKTIVWLGKFCSEQEIEMARHMGTYLSKDREPATVLKEGEEGVEFWDLLGGEKEPYKNTKRQLTGATLEFTPRLFQCSMSSGRFAVEEIVSYCQDDLDETDVMILDTHDEIFIWLGDKCHEFEKKEAAKTAKNYLLSDPDGRTPDNTLIIVVRQGFEPPQFTGCFLAWDTNKWAEGKSFKDICKELGQENAGISLLEDEVKKYTSFYSLDVLQRKVPPEGVDVLRKEMYLSPEDFHQVFHMTKDEFNKLPEWKRTNLRKEHDLF